MSNAAEFSDRGRRHRPARNVVEKFALHDVVRGVSVDNRGPRASPRRQEPGAGSGADGLSGCRYDGREVVRGLRKGGFTARSIMLTGLDTTPDTILGLESGPTTMWRNRSASRCCWRDPRPVAPARNSEDAVFGRPYSFRPGAKMFVDSAGKKIRLTEKENRSILRCPLPRPASRRCHARRCLQEVWGYNSGRHHPYSRNPYLSGCARRSSATPPTPKILMTESGGYKLVP